MKTFWIVFIISFISCGLGFIAGHQGFKHFKMKDYVHQSALQGCEITASSLNASLEKVEQEWRVCDAKLTYMVDQFLTCIEVAKDLSKKCNKKK